MKKTDAHQFVMQALQDYLNTLPKSSAVALGEKLQACMSALAPSPDTTPVAGEDHG